MKTASKITMTTLKQIKNKTQLQHGVNLTLFCHSPI